MSSPRTIIFYLGAQASIRQALEHVRPGGHRTLEVRPEVEAAPDREPQARFAGTAWTGCDCWHRDRHGRIVANWPGYIPEYLQRTRRFAAAMRVQLRAGATHRMRREHSIRHHHMIVLYALTEAGRQLLDAHLELVGHAQ